MILFDNFENYEYFKTVEKYANSRSWGVKANFYKLMDYLTNYGGEDEYGRQIYNVYLWRDSWCDYSFHIVWVYARSTKNRNVGQSFMSGGMTYYLPGESGVGYPQFSVRLGGDGGEEWRINT